MRLNPRYVFFSLAPDDGRQPVGAANVPLPPGRALAVDPAFHPMGELYWIDASAPILNGAFPAYRRLAMALDTGGAIKGDVRADLYLGQGAAAGAEAGRVRHTLRLYRLVPKDAAPMKRPLKPEERHIWGMVAATVHPLPGRATPRPSRPTPCRSRRGARPPPGIAAAARRRPARTAKLRASGSTAIEPNRTPPHRPGARGRSARGSTCTAWTRTAPAAVLERLPAPAPGTKAGARCW